MCLYGKLYMRIWQWQSYPRGNKEDPHVDYVLGGGAIRGIGAVRFSHDSKQK